MLFSVPEFLDFILLGGKPKGWDLFGPIHSSESWPADPQESGPRPAEGSAGGARAPPLRAGARARGARGARGEAEEGEEGAGSLLWPVLAQLVDSLVG